MRIAIITAGGAGMFCGSCMQDNTLARALRMAGADALLLPTYTPIRVDEVNASQGRVFLGGINVYLDSAVPGWRMLPRFAKSWLDRPSIVNWLARRFGGTDAASLGPLTIDMLKGEQGPQRQEFRELREWLCRELKPDVILLSNALLSGLVPALRSEFAGRIACLLQGDDIFLDALPEPWRSRATSAMAANLRGVDAFLAHSRYYALAMSDRLQLQNDKLRTIPLLIEEQNPTEPIVARTNARSTDSIAAQPITIGYFARICPEKGAFRFLDAVERCSHLERLQFVIGGYLPEQHAAKFRARRSALQAKLGDRFFHAGSPESREEKFRLLSTFDWLCVPTEYREPKGLFVLEAALAGVSSILPAHGAFPERIESLQCGRLFDPAIATALDEILHDIASGNLTRPDETERRALQSRCLEVFGMQSGGAAILDALQATL